MSPEAIADLLVAGAQYLGAAMALYALVSTGVWVAKVWLGRRRRDDEG